MKPVRILLAAEANLIRRGLRPPLEAEPDWHICGETGSGREAVRMAERFRPEIVVIDAALPELDGLEAARRIKSARPQTEVLILTTDENEELVNQILAIGARGYLPRSEAAGKIVSAIKALCDHRHYLDSPASKLAFENHLRREVEKEREKSGNPLPPGAPITPAPPSPPSTTRRP